MTDELAAPYAAAYTDYWNAGWRGILPLPVGQKYPPPNGYTGANGLTPSFADVTDWAMQTPDGNIALRLPETVIGLDVDAYGDKTGGDTLADLVHKCGPLPATVLSTSRGDGVSGIRLYTIPEGVRLINGLPGLELIQHHHRYAVCWPSTHPKTGDRYQWLDERTGAVGDIPQLADLPPLPQPWINELANTSDTADKNTDTQVGPLVNAFPEGDPCHHIVKAAGKALTEPGQSRHDAYMAAVLAVMGHARRGCPGGKDTLKTMRDTFVALIGDRATPSEATQEFGRMVEGGAQIVANEAPGDACPDDLSWLPDDPGPLTPPPATAGTDTPAGGGDTARWDAEVARRVVDLLIAREAKDKVAAIDAGATPPLEAVDLGDFVNQDDDDPQYRVTDLWPLKGRTLLVAAAKAGKTTMVGRNLLPCLVDGGQFLGEFHVTPVTGRVVYLNLEVSDNVMRAWLKSTRIVNTHKVAVVNLRGRVSSINLASREGRDKFAEFLRAQDAEVVILDPLAPLLAAHGLDENSNADVARFFSWWSEALTLADVTDDLIAHHAGHAGERSRGASRLLDEPDAVWTITTDRGQASNDDDPGDAPIIRTLAAYGRDVEHPERVLSFDAATGGLTLEPFTRRQFKADTRRRGDEMSILHALEQSPRPLSTTELTDKDKRRAGVLRQLVTAGKVVAMPGGPGQATLHTLPPGGTP